MSETEKVPEGTRCGCWDRFCVDRNDEFHPQGKDRHCVRDAVRLVRISYGGKSMFSGMPVLKAMCEPCAQYHEAKKTVK